MKTTVPLSGNRLVTVEHTEEPKRVVAVCVVAATMPDAALIAHIKQLPKVKSVEVRRV